MSDNPSGTEERTNDLDFSGLLPGDDQPRRSRRARRDRPAPNADAPTSADILTGETSLADPAGEDPEVARQPEAVGTAGEVQPDEGVGEGDSIAPASAEDISTTEEPGESHDEPSESSDPPPSTQTEDAAGALNPRTSEPKSEPMTTPASTRASHSATHTGDGGVPGSGPADGAADVHEAGADPGRRRDVDDTSRGIADVGGPSAATPVRIPGLSDGLSKALDEQAVVLDGHELDSRLQQVAQLSPQQRSRYKTTLLLSEEHYDLLSDLCRDFRKRGFKANEATMSNIVCVGLEAAREALEADQNLPE